MSLMPYYGPNIYVKQLDTRYSETIMSLNPAQRVIVQDIVRLSYLAGKEDEKRRNLRMKAKVKTKKNVDSEDDD